MPPPAYCDAMNSQLDEITGRLRKIRRSRKLTLAAIQDISHGDINAISLGSYERGDRALTVKKAIEIAQFYEIPLSYLLTGISPNGYMTRRIVIDLRRAKDLLQGSDTESSPTQKITLFSFRELSRCDRILTAKCSHCEKRIVTT